MVLVLGLGLGLVLVLMLGLGLGQDSWRMRLNCWSASALRVFPQHDSLINEKERRRSRGTHCVPESLSFSGRQLSAHAPRQEAPRTYHMTCRTVRDRCGSLPHI